MHGHNKRFIENTRLYLQGNALFIDQAIAPVVNAAGIAAFDLLPLGNNRTKLIPWAAHAKTHRFGTQRPINAYWLPYVSRQTHSRALGALANFMFTAELTGCFIGIGAGVNPTVAHVAGDIPLPGGVAGVAGPPALVAAATAAIGGAPGRQFNSNTADAASMSFVGARNTATGLWAFHAQGNTGQVGQDHGGGIRLMHVFDTPANAANNGFAGQGAQHVVTL